MEFVGRVSPAIFLGAEKERSGSDEKMAPAEISQRVVFQERVIVERVFFCPVTASTDVSFTVAVVPIHFPCGGVIGAWRYSQGGAGRSVSAF